MKISKVVLGLGLVASLPVMAEPYAEWGVLGKDTPLQELDPEMRMPGALDVPIPPPPGAKFVGISGDKFCNMGLRTKRSVKEVCNYYTSKLSPLGYAQVNAAGFSSSGCEIYKSGDMETDLGVMVSRHDDPMFVENGSTLVVVSYPSEDGKTCSK